MDCRGALEIASTIHIYIYTAIIKNVCGAKKIMLYIPLRDLSLCQHQGRDLNNGGGADVALITDQPGRTSQNINVVRKGENMQGKESWPHKLIRVEL